MASNLNVSVTADTTKLQSSLAIAEAELRSLRTEVKATANEIAAASSTAMPDLMTKLDGLVPKANAAKAAVDGMKATLGTTTAALKTTATAIEAEGHAMNQTGVAREAMVLAHELMQGRINRVSGSLMVMAERVGGGSMALMGMVGVFALATMGAMHLVEWLDKVSEAKLLASAGATGSNMAKVDTDAAVAQLTHLEGVSSETAGKVANSLTSLAGMTAAPLTLIIANLRSLSLRMGEDVPQAASKVAAAWNLDARAGAELLNRTHASAAAVKAFTTAAENNDGLKARTILLTQLARSTKDVERQTGESMGSKEAAELSAAQVAARSSFNSGTPAQKQGLVDRAEMQGAIEDTKQLNTAIAGLSGVMKVETPEAWGTVQKTALDTLVLATEEADQKQKKTWAQTHEDMTRVAVTFWGKQLQETKEGTKNHEEALRNFLGAKEQLAAQEIRLDASAGKAGAAAAKEALREKLSALTAEQAAYHDNFAQVMVLEDEKIALLRAAGKTETVELNRELKTRDTLIREHADRTAATELEALVRSEHLYAEQTATLRATLDAQVSDHLITKQAEILQIEAYAASQYQIEHAALDLFITTHQAETASLTKALADRLALETGYQKEVAQLHAQEVKASVDAARMTEQRYLSMFDSIGSTAERTTSSLIMGSTTWQKAELQIAGSVAQQAITFGIQTVKEWAATEIAKTALSTTATRARVAAEQQSGASGWGALLAQWLGLETSKTGVTVVADTSRTVSAVTANTVQTASTVTAQAVQTAAVVAGSEAQAAVTIASKAEAAAASAAINGPSIMADAAKAAAGAYAAVAGIPYVGPVLAPIAAGVAFTAVAAYSSMASFAVGAWELPNDMVAQVHKGEMIIPASQAEQIRSGSGGGGGRIGAGGSPGGDTHHHYNISAIDGASVQAFFNKHARIMAASNSRATTRNPGLRPNY